MFEILYRTVQEFKDTDRVFLAYALEDQNIVNISESTYYRGMKELLNKGFIAETTVQNSYFINPAFIFNGDCLSFVKSYVLTKSSSIKELK
ncbi:replication protein [Erwinia oleae]|uniref:replication protein n=1 Tax=Erwinia oleae TaxID=796334 RepID=UPI001F37B576|nr:replication protein [Erwinia oleae]